MEELKIGRQTGLEPLRSRLAPGAVATSETINAWRADLEEAILKVKQDLQSTRSMVQQMGTWFGGMMLGINTLYGPLINSYMAKVDDLNQIFWPVGWGTGWTIPSSMYDSTYDLITAPVEEDIYTAAGNRIYVRYVGVQDYHFNDDIGALGGDLELDAGNITRPDRWDSLVVIPRVNPSAEFESIRVSVPLISSGGAWTNNIEIVAVPWSRGSLSGKRYGVHVGSLTGIGASGRWYSELLDTDMPPIAADRIFWETDNPAWGQQIALTVEIRVYGAHIYPALIRFAPRATRFSTTAGTVTLDCDQIRSGTSIKKWKVVYTPVTRGAYSGSPYTETNYPVTGSVQGSSNNVLELNVAPYSPYFGPAIRGVYLHIE